MAVYGPGGRGERSRNDPEPYGSLPCQYVTISSHLDSFGTKSVDFHKIENPGKQISGLHFSRKHVLIPWI